MGEEENALSLIHDILLLGRRKFHLQKKKLQPEHVSLDQIGFQLFISHSLSLFYCL